MKGGACLSTCISRSARGAKNLIPYSDKGPVKIYGNTGPARFIRGHLKYHCLYCTGRFTILVRTDTGSFEISLSILYGAVYYFAKN